MSRRALILLSVHALFALALATVVSHVRLSTDLRSLPPAETTFIAGLAIAHVFAALIAHGRSRGEHAPGFLRIGLAVALAYGTLSAGILLADLGAFSRTGFVLAVASTGAFLSLERLDRWRGQAMLLAGAGMAALAIVTVPPPEVADDPEPVEAETGRFAPARPGLTAADFSEPVVGSPAPARYIPTSFYSIKLSLQAGLIPSVATGGGMSAVSLGLLVVSADGNPFLIATSDPSGNLVRSPALPQVPTNRDGLERYVRALPLTGELTPAAIHSREIMNFRVLDVFVRESDGQAQILVSHHFWHESERCFGVRVSQASTPVASLRHVPRELQWQTLYDTTPCLPLDTSVNFEQGGGRLARLDEHTILLAVGDQGTGMSLVQDPRTDYGKTIRIDLRSGTATHITTGHRNPQGLLVGADGRIWETEHGPRGGDELNLLAPDQNYGWPRVTLGTAYGDRVWPGNPVQSRHDGFAAPVFAWVPSIGVSQVIEVRGGQFEVWRGDLLVSSLTAGSLFRMRVDDGAVRYAEPLFIGGRVRDLEELADGRIVLLLDDGAMGILTVASESDPEAAVVPPLFESCRECHLVGGGRDHRTGPDLWKIVGRDIAGAPGFVYSDALRRVPGTWTRESLSRFLQDPAAFAPGTTMPPPESRYAAELARLIDYLETLR